MWIHEKRHMSNNALPSHMIFGDTSWISRKMFLFGYTATCEEQSQLITIHEYKHHSPSNIILSMTTFTTPYTQAQHIRIAWPLPSSPGAYKYSHAQPQSFHTYPFLWYRRTASPPSPSINSRISSVKTRIIIVLLAS
jgi:hypothetical protein